MENNIQHNMQNNNDAWKRAGIVCGIILASALGFVYWKTSASQISIDSASIVAPVTALGTPISGTLHEVLVQEGDYVSANTPVAQVGTSLVKTTSSGVIVSVPNTVGALMTSGSAVVSMIDPTQLRVIGKIDEDKGLNKISVGNKVVFTVDTFGSKKYTGIVDEISPMSVQSGIVFSISDKRETKQFAIKVRFDTSANPELKNGMSARIRIYTK